MCGLYCLYWPGWSDVGSRSTVMLYSTQHLEVHKLLGQNNATHTHIYIYINIGVPRGQSSKVGWQATVHLQHLAQRSRSTWKLFACQVSVWASTLTLRYPLETTASSRCKWRRSRSNSKISSLTFLATLRDSNLRTQRVRNYGSTMFYPLVI